MHYAERSLLLLRLVICAYSASTTFLVMNNLVNPDHESLETDQQLIDFAIEAIGKTADETQNQRWINMLEACKELNLLAHVVIDGWKNGDAMWGLVDGAFEPEMATLSSMGLGVGDESDLQDDLLNFYDLESIHANFGTGSASSEH
jgi:hypothetical protein